MFSDVIYSVLRIFFGVFLIEHGSCMNCFLKVFTRILTLLKQLDFLLPTQVISKGYYEFLQLTF